MNARLVRYVAMLMCLIAATSTTMAQDEAFTYTPETLGPIAVGKTDIQVYCSRWVDMLPDGTTVEGKGVPPTVAVKVPPETYRTADPTLEKALELLRKK